MTSQEAKKIIASAKFAYPSPTSLRRTEIPTYCVGHAVVTTIDPKVQCPKFPTNNLVWEYLQKKFNLPQDNKIDVCEAIEANEEEQFDEAWNLFEKALTSK